MEENVLNSHGLVRHMCYWTPLHGLIDQRTLKTFPRKRKIKIPGRGTNLLRYDYRNLVRLNASLIRRRRE